MPKAPRSVFDLTPAEKLQLVQDLWDDLASSPENVPLQDWQRAELDRRLADFERDPNSRSPWPEVKKQLRARHGR
jgi:putative addiction module component (TIGR02574 family)